MKGLLSRRRYEVLVLSIALLCSALHVWADTSPVVRDASSAASGADALLLGVQYLEGRATDLQFQFRGARPAHPDVVVVAIDDRSTQRYGLWPWSRSLTARAVRAMHAAGARVIGLDVAFIDESRDTAVEAYRDVLTAVDALAQAGDLAPRLASLRQMLTDRSRRAPDAELEDAFRQSPQLVQGVIGYPSSALKLFEPSKVQEHARLLEPFVVRTQRGPGGTTVELPLRKLRSWTLYSAEAPLARFARASRRLGFFNSTPDPDGTLRRTALLAKLAEPLGLLPSLDLAIAAEALGAEIEPVYFPGGEPLNVHAVRLRRADGSAVEIPAQETEPFALIDHLGPAAAIPSVSMADVLDGTSAQLLRGKVLVVGVTTVGSAASDVRVTPFSESGDPGVYVHASMVSNILANAFLRRPAELRLLEALSMFAIGLLLALLLPRISFKLKFLLIIAVVAAWLVADQLLFSRAGLQLATILPLANTLVSAFGVIFLGYLTADRDKAALRKTFSQYLGEDVMEEALKNPEKLQRGEKREMTVLFSDIRGFTTLAERMVPEMLARFIKDYLNPMTQVVFEEKGTLDKYIGDAVMAFWNAPLDQADHAVRACRAAVKMHRRLEALKVQWRAQNLPEFDIGVGVNTGPMVVGNMGSDTRVDYTVLGDAVNLAARLEGTNKEYETRILISESTWAQAKDHIIARRLGAVRVKGKRKPVRIYELRDLGQAAGKDLEAITAFEAAVDAFAQQRFDDARSGFQRVLELWPEDPPARRYLDEIEELRERPPAPGWDGVYTAKTK